MNRYSYLARLWYGPHDGETVHMSLVAESETEAMLTIVDWQMEIGRKLNRQQPKQSEYPSRWKRPKNLTWLELLKVEELND